MLASYYDARLADRFDDWFRGTEIGRNPTPERNRLMALQLDFSTVEIGTDLGEIPAAFDRAINLRLDTFIAKNEQFFRARFQIDPVASASHNLSATLQAIAKYDLPPMFITVDEYDNFANQLMTGLDDRFCAELMGDNSFLKTFFKILKNGRGEQTISRIFITGVLPIAFDDLASGFNIAQFLTLREDFETLAGFTRDEVAGLLDRVYADNALDPATRVQVEEAVRNNYNGYRFTGRAGEDHEVYNPTLVLYFLDQLTTGGRIPETLTDENLKTDLSWVKRLTASDPAQTKALIDKLTIENQIPYNRALLTDKFDLARFLTAEFFLISFYYLGLFTRRDDYHMCLPNLHMKGIFAQYFNQLHEIDVSLRYIDLMKRFVEKPDLNELMAGYHRLYIGQLPEAVFQKVNENFYRTTFYVLCRQYLSQQFYWSMEASLPSGRTDLEMIGKHHSPFAGMRIVMEFKYISNAAVKRQQIDPACFQAPSEDCRQLENYLMHRRRECPEESLEGYLVYCFGNTAIRTVRIA